MVLVVCNVKNEKLKGESLRLSQAGDFRERAQLERTSPKEISFRRSFTKHGIFGSGCFGGLSDMQILFADAKFAQNNIFVSPLDGRNRAMVIAESLARVIAAIRITSVRWRSYLPLKTQKLVLIDPAFVALLFESRDWPSLV